MSDFHFYSLSLLNRNRQQCMITKYFRSHMVSFAFFLLIPFSFFIYRRMYFVFEWGWCDGKGNRFICCVCSCHVPVVDHPVWGGGGQWAFLAGWRPQNPLRRKSSLIADKHSSGWSPCPLLQGMQRGSARTALPLIHHQLGFSLSFGMQMAQVMLLWKLS